MEEQVKGHGEVREDLHDGLDEPEGPLQAD